MASRRHACQCLLHRSAFMTPGGRESRFLRATCPSVSHSLSRNEVVKAAVSSPSSLPFALSLFNRSCRTYFFISGLILALCPLVLTLLLVRCHFAVGGGHAGQFSSDRGRRERAESDSNERCRIVIERVLNETYVHRTATALPLSQPFSLNLRRSTRTYE